jgi:hypothetical protein
MTTPESIQRAIRDMVTTIENEKAAGKTADGAIRCNATIKTAIRAIDAMWADPDTWTYGVLGGRHGDLVALNADWHHIKTQLLIMALNLADDMLADMPPGSHA